MAPPVPTKGGGSFLTKKFGPLPMWAWAGLAVGGYLIYRMRKASEAASTAASSTTASGTSTPTELTPVQSAGTGYTSGGSGYTGGGGSGNTPAGYQYQGPGVGTGSIGAVPTGATAVTSAASAAPAAPATGYGTSTFGGVPYITLGTIVGPGGAYSGYNVGGGAPVFYATPGSSNLQTNLTPAAVAALPGGTQVFTPQGYAGAVSSQTAQETI
jgi:hypothetical protein